MGKILLRLFLLATLLLPASCMDYGPGDPENMPLSGRGLFIINEGNFTESTATLSFYDIDSKTVENEVFFRANAFLLGDVAQSMAIHDGLGYIVVNNSNVIWVIDLDTFKRIDKITGLVSPRYIHFVSDEKAYVTDLYGSYITIFDPRTREVTGRIPVTVIGKTEPSTEQMVQYDKYVFTNSWSYDNRIVVIDTEIDQVVDIIEVGVQPTSIIIDKYDQIWTLTDGGYAGSPYGHEAPALYRIDAASRTIKDKFEFNLGDYASEICLDGEGDHLYFINKHIWRMDVTATELPREPFIANNSRNIWYGLTVDPLTSEVYLADAIDYSQPGRVYRYGADGEPVDDFKVGIIPGAFCFKPTPEEGR